MATTREDIRGWLNEGKAQGASHVIVVCDGFDHSDYPTFMTLVGNPAANEKRVRDKVAETDMQHIVEVYALHLPWEPQLAEWRAFHWEAPPDVGWHTAESRECFRVRHKVKG